MINQTDEFLGFLDPVVVVQVPGSFEGEDLQEDEGLEGDEDEDVFRNPEPLSGLGVREFGEDEVEEVGEGLAEGDADLVESAQFGEVRGGYFIYVEGHEGRVESGAEALEESAGYDGDWRVDQHDGHCDEGDSIGDQEAVPI